MKRIIFPILALLAVSNVMAQTVGSDGDFTYVVRTILTNNPELKSMSESLRAERLEATDANSLANPEIGVSRLWGNNGAGNKFEIEVSQSFDWPGLYRARSQAAKAGVSASQMLLMSRRLDIALDVRQKLNELVYLNKKWNLLKRIKENTDSVQAQTEKAYRGGELTILDSKKMQIEQFNINNEIAELDGEIFRLKAEIQALCPDVELDLTGFNAYSVEPKLSTDDYLAQIEALDPVISAGRLSAEHEELNAKAASRQRLPGFSVGYIYQKEIGDVFNGFSVSMSLPFFQNRKARTAALSRAESARISNESAIAARRADVISTLRDMELLQRQIDEYNRIFGDNTYLPLLLMAYKGGQINVIDYLSEVNYFFSITKDYLDCQYKYNQSLSSLNRYNLLLDPR